MASPLRIAHEYVVKIEECNIVKKSLKNKYEITDAFIQFIPVSSVLFRSVPFILFYFVSFRSLLLPSPLISDVLLLSVPYQAAQTMFLQTMVPMRGMEILMQNTWASCG